MTSPEWLRTVYIGQIIWKEIGWSTIIYLAAITVVDTQLYEAAEMDGAARLRKTWHITLLGDSSNHYYLAYSEDWPHAGSGL